MGCFAANMNKTFTTGLRSMENRPTALAGVEKRTIALRAMEMYPFYRLFFTELCGTLPSIHSPTAQRGGKGTRFVGEHSDLRIV